MTKHDALASVFSLASLARFEQQLSSTPLPYRDVVDDEAAVFFFLGKKTQKDASRKAFTRDFRKLAVFMAVRNLHGFHQIGQAETHQFRDFLMNPPSHLLLPSGHQQRTLFETFLLPNGEVNEQWRPFQRPQSPGTAHQTIRTLMYFWKWMNSINYMNTNPWQDALETLKSYPAPEPTRQFSTNPIPVIAAFLGQRTPQNKIEQYRYAQQRWLFHVFSVEAACFSIRTQVFPDTRAAMYTVTILM